MRQAEIAIIGAGPRGINVLERLSASARELLGPRELVVHLIDPFPPGPGRIWRYAQSALMRMNSMPEDVTMFTDDSVVMAGPVRPGPSLADWAEQVRAGELDVQLPADVAAELAVLPRTGFPTRRLQSVYLDWVYRHVLAGLPDTVRVREHADTAAGLTELPDGTQLVSLAGGATVRADVVLLAVGHLDVEPDEESRQLAAYADAHDLRYYPAGYTADLDYSAVPAGEPVLVRGFGLAFVDLLMLLTEDRGGRFTEREDGTLRYLPSGREPLLHVGSRRGVPYHAKPGYRLQGERPKLPMFFGDAVLRELLASEGKLDFRTDVWPYAAKELAWGYYHELGTGHPERLGIPFDEFAAKFAAADWGSPEMDSLVRTAVPAEEDRFDIDAIDRPLAGMQFGGAAEFNKYVHEYVRADLARRADSHYSADLGAFTALLSVFGRLAELGGAEKFTPASQLFGVDNWFFGFFSYFASGPPPRRLEELLALHEAGIVTFAGPDMQLSTVDGEFAASSPGVPGVSTARVLIEGMLPAPSVRRAADPLLSSLHGAGALAEGEREQQPPSGRIWTRVADGRVRDADGAVHPRRFALGPHTSARSPAAFTRPGVNALPFRHSDAVARQLLLACRDA